MESVEILECTLRNGSYVKSSYMFMEGIYDR
jgi:hypothetical protein